MQNARKLRNIKLVKTERRRNYLVSEPSYHTTKFFIKKLVGNRYKKDRHLRINKNKYL